METVLTHKFYMELVAMFGNKKNDSSSAQLDEAAPELPSVVKMIINKNGAASTNALDANSAEANDEPTMLSAGAVFKGVLASKGPVHALGKFDGEIDSPYVTLGSTGRISGKLKCKKFIIDGKFDGELNCDEVIAGPAAVLDGVIALRSVKLALGAVVNGKVEIGKR